LPDWIILTAVCALSSGPGAAAEGKAAIPKMQPAVAAAALPEFIHWTNDWMNWLHSGRRRALWGGVFRMVRHMVRQW
jgi:hypothetical protein